MPKRKVSREPKGPSTTRVLEPNAAGIDIGAMEIYVAVPADRDPRPVRSFATFTRELEKLAEWLQQCGIQSVAMESTGVFWIPLFQLLEERGFRVCLVNARHVKNVPGRKTDVADCQWLQYLHAVGLLRASHRPSQDICTLRSLWRHRESLVQMAAVHIQHMQKALDQMNLQLHHVISDITGTTGLAIVEALLAGERDPKRLARLRDRRIAASEETVAQALVGDYRPEHLFTLRQSLQAYRQYQRWMAECDREIEQYLGTLGSRLETGHKPLSRPKDRHKPRRNEPRLDLRTHLYRIFGVDLTEVPGVNVLTAHTFLTEVGPDLRKFPNDAAFASWLGVCPDNRISGGQVLSVKTRKVINRLSLALRRAAQSLHRSQSYLGQYFRRIRTRLGTPAAITAAAHKLARVLYHLIKTRQPYQESVFAIVEERARHRQFIRLKRQASALGFQLTPNACVP
jgi:transposase